MKFKSRKGPTVYFFTFGSIAVMLSSILPLFSEGIKMVTLLLILFVLLISGALLWMVFGTYYKINNGLVEYRSGPLKGKIPITSIHTVIKGKTLWVGYRPATATKGVILKYNKYDEIYFSPDSNERFVAELLKSNAGIKVEES